MANIIKVSASVLILAAAGSIGLATLANAETAATTTAKPDIACLQVPAKVSDNDLQSFLKDPKALLTNNPAGGLPLSTSVRELAGSSNRAFDQIMVLTKDANAGQKSAIAAGLARVVYICGTVGTTPAQDYAASIQASVAGFGDPAFASTFLEASKDVNVASNGPGAGGVTVGGGATGPDDSQYSGTNDYKSPGDNPLDTTSGEYTTNTNSGSTVGDVNSGGTETVIISQF